MNLDSRIFVAGHRGMVGSAIVRRLVRDNYSNIIQVGRDRVDLRDPVAVEWMFSAFQPEYVFLAAARVGGIIDNKEHPADFIVQNLQIQTNVISMAHKYGVKKLLFLGSACAYPKHAPVPVRENSLLTGPLEDSNRAYAIAKIAGIEMCNAFRRQYGCNFISCMPTNLYGPGDHYHAENSHVLPSLIMKIHEAKLENRPSVTVWGTGTPVRDFLYVDDLADACVFLMDRYNAPGPINVASDDPVSISVLASIVAESLRYSGTIEFDSSRPDGTPDRTMDCGKLSSKGWYASTGLISGVDKTCADYLCRLQS